MSDLAFRPMRATDDDLRLFGECFARNGSPKSEERLRWQYLANPTGEIFVDLALTGDRAAAIYASLPVRLRIGADVHLSLQSLDTLTDADFRGKGLFVKLASSLFERATRAGAQLIYGFPNGNSAHGFFHKLGWSPLDPVPFLVRPLRTRYFVDKLDRFLGPAAAVTRVVPDFPLPVMPFTSRSAEEIHGFDERFDDLWCSFIGSGRVAVERDARYLEWRLTNKPEEDYRRLAITSRGRVEAFIAYCTKEKHEGTIGYVMELLHRPGARLAAWSLLQRALADMAGQGADLALAWCLPTSLNFGAFVASGFLPLPEKLRPIELHVGVRPFTKLPQDVCDRSRWYLSYLDSDTV